MTSELFEHAITKTEYQEIYNGFKRWAISQKKTNFAALTPVKFNDLVMEYISKTNAILNELAGHGPRSFQSFYSEKMEFGKPVGVSAATVSSKPDRVQAFPTFKAWLAKQYGAEVNYWQRRLKGDDSPSAKRIIEIRKRNKKAMESLYLRQLTWWAARHAHDKQLSEQLQSEMSPRTFNKLIQSYAKLVRKDLKNMAFFYKAYQDAKHEIDRAKKSVERHKHVREMVSPQMRAKHRELLPLKARGDMAIKALRSLSYQGKILAAEVNELNASMNHAWKSIVADLHEDYLVDLDKLSEFSKMVTKLEAKVKRFKS